MPGVELISSSTLLLTKARVWTPGAVSPRAVRKMEKLQDDKSWCPQGLCQLWGSAEPPRSLPGYFFCLEIQVLPKLCPIEEEAGWGLGGPGNALDLSQLLGVDLFVSPLQGQRARKCR